MDLLDIDTNVPVAEHLGNWGGRDLPPEALRHVKIGDLVRVRVSGWGLYFAIVKIVPHTNPKEIVYHAVYGQIYERMYEIELQLETPLQPGEVYIFPAKLVYEIPKPILRAKDLKNRNGELSYPKSNKDDNR